MHLFRALVFAAVVAGGIAGLFVRLFSRWLLEGRLPVE